MRDGEELRTSRTGRTHLTGGVEGTFCVWVTWRDEGNNVYFVGKSHVSALALLEAENGLAYFGEQ